MLSKSNNKVTIKKNVKVDKEGVFSGRDTNITNIYHVDSKTILMEHIPLNVSGYIRRTVERKKLLNLITENEVIQVYGISGIGKTELVQDIATELNEKYAKSYFISSYENEEVNLSQVNSFSGSKLNLLNQVKLYKTLIVIDNYNCTIDKLVQEFKHVNNHDSRLVIVSQAKISSSIIEHYNLGFMTYEEALELFNGSERIDIDSIEFKNFLNNVDKHPMMLQVLKNYIEDKDNGMDFSDYQDDLLNIVKLEDETKSQSKRICESIVGRYTSTLYKSFNLIRYIDSNCIEKTFFKAIMKCDIPSLSKRLLIKDREDHYYIHDIIKESIKAVTKSESGVIPEKDKILLYLSSKIESKSVDYYQFLAFNSELIIKLLNDVVHRKDKVILYNLVVTYSNHRELNKHIKNIEAILDNNFEYTYFEVKLYIERLEMLIKLSIDDKETLINSTIDRLKKLDSKVKEDEKINQLIKHHIGKLCNWNKNYEEAIKIFNEIIEKDDKAYKTVLQLCRAHRNLALNAQDEKNRNEHVEIVSNLLKSINLKKIPVSVYLEILALIRNRPLNKSNVLDTCLWSNFDYFSKIALLYSKNKIFEHIYITIGGLASNISYNKKSFFKEWFEQIEHPAIEYNNHNLVTSIINIYVAEIMRRKFARPEENYDNLVESVIDIWGRQKTLIKEDKVKHLEFRYKPIIELLLKIGKFQLAEKELNEIYRVDNEWHRRYRAKILENKCLYDESVNELKKGIKILNEKKQNKYLSTFHNDLADLYYHSKKPECIVSLKEAIELCDNKKTFICWNKKLEQWKKEF